MQKKYYRTEENKYKDYKKKAEKRKREFSINIEDAKLYFHGSCYYCNEKYNGYKESSNKLKLNGIDRKNNDIGYNTNNCVSCCNKCNFLKGSLDPITFINRCKHILYYNNLIDVEYKLDYKIFGDSKSGRYQQYKKRSKDFLLTYEEFNKIINENCYICGKENSDTHTNGIDNCKACCGECNYMKGHNNLNELFTTLKQIYNNNAVNYEEKIPIINKINLRKN